MMLKYSVPGNWVMAELRAFELWREGESHQGEEGGTYQH